MSESLTVEGWRVRGDDRGRSSDCAVRGPVRRACRFPGAAIGAELSFDGSLLVADVMGLVLAFVLANALVSSVASIGRPGQPGIRVPGVPPRDPRLARPPASRGALRPGRGADRPLDGRRHRRCVPKRHDRRLDLRHLRRRDQPRAPGARPARRLLARRCRPDPDPARDRADALPPPARLRAERRHRRRGARRPAARPQADEPSRVRHQPRGLRRRSSHRARRPARPTASVAAWAVRTGCANV